MQLSSVSTFADSSPLLEKERYTSHAALDIYRVDPFRVHESCTRTRFTAYDHPMNTLQRQIFQWPYERLT